MLSVPYLGSPIQIGSMFGFVKMFVGTSRTLLCPSRWVYLRIQTLGLLRVVFRAPRYGFSYRSRMGPVKTFFWQRVLELVLGELSISLQIGPLEKVLC